MNLEIKKFVVKIQERRLGFLGTGVQVAKTYILTCKHLVQNDRRRIRKVQISAGDQDQWINGEVIAVDPDDDLALILIEKSQQTPEEWILDVRRGLQISLVGFKKSGPIMTEGSVKGTTFNDAGEVISIEVEAGVPSGMSGGIALGLKGTKVGIVGLIKEGGEEVRFANLAAAGSVARFLSGNGLRLPGWPSAESIAKTVSKSSTDEAQAYLTRLRQEVEFINIGSIDRDSIKAALVPINKVYVPLNALGAEDTNEPLTNKLPSRSKRFEISGRRLESALSERLLIIEGDAGSGKSTFMRCVAYELSHKAGSTPLLMPIRAFPLYVRIAELDRHIAKMDERNVPGTPTGPTNARWVANYLGEIGWGATEHFFNSRLQETDTLLLLDGLDEAPNDERRKRMAELLRQVALQYGKCRIVLTTRPQALRGDGRPVGFTKVRIDALDKPGVDLFVHHWCQCLYANNKNAAEHQQAALRSALEAPEVSQMARNPMMLSALAVLHWNGKKLPDNRLDLYEAIIRWLAQSHAHLPGQPDWETRRERLSLLAFGMQSYPGGRIRQIEMRAGAALLKPLDESSALRCLRDEEADSGILARRGENVEFVHLTFQEYLAAREISGHDISEIAEIVYEDRRLYSSEWSGVLRFLAAELRRPGPKRANMLFDLVLKYGEIRPSGFARSGDDARKVALLTTLKDDLRRRSSDGKTYEFEVTNRQYDVLTASMTNLFKSAEAGMGLDAATRAAAAEAWERLRDTSQLYYPSDHDYWINLKRFRIARYPVTVWEYAVFVEDQGVPPSDWDLQLTYLNRPVVGVSWNQAASYCRWLSDKYGHANGRLPTNDEWEYAASGDRNRDYPWGSAEPDDERANFGDRIGRITPVGLFPLGNTPEGIADLAGNIWEWTSSPVTETRIVRGGTFRSDARALRSTANKGFGKPDEAGPHVGFRCACD